jgi:molybdopterin-containing oxidoreductase family molybdopterin binding subunit
VQKEQPIVEDKWIKSVCYMCQCADTGIRAHRVNGVIVKVEGDPDCPPNYGRQCAKGLSAIMMPYNPNRLLKPVRRTNPEKGLGVDPKWVEISWDEAINTFAERLKKIRADNPLKLMMSSFDYPPYLFAGTWLRTFGGQFWFGGSTWCGWYHNTSYQYHASFFREADYEHCNYVLLWGTQTGHMVDALPVLSAREVAEARLRGMKVVSVDPVCMHAGSKADEWIPIKPGTDAALALGMINLLLNEYKIYDVDHLKRFTNGPYLIGQDGLYVRDKSTKKPMVWDQKESKAKPFNQVEWKNMALEGKFTVDGASCQPSFQILKEHVKKYPPEEVSKITGIPVETIRRTSKEFGEAVQIGSKIVIDGVELPHRPACVIHGRGATAHRHAMHSVYALELLNVLMGAVNVPGGVLGISTYYKRRWWPKEDEDGIMLSDNWYFKFGCLDPYPARKVVKPMLYNLTELCPIASYSDNFVPFVMHDPRRFKIPYDIEMMIITHVNPVMTVGNPEEVVGLLKKIPFIVGMATEMNEAIEMCDIVLPQAHWTERYDPIANPPFKFEAVGKKDWYWFFRRPILDPPPGVKHWVEILFELAEKIGLSKEWYETMNWYNDLREPNKLDPNRKYTYMEVCDRILKDRYGVGIDYFESTGTQFFQQKKDIEEAFPRMFTPGRVPIYLEYWQRAGEDVKKVVKELGIEDIWETDDYTALVDWKPCIGYEPKGEYDMLVVNYKLPYHTFSWSLNNPWLKEIGDNLPEAYGIQINSKTAEKKGIKDGDQIAIETTNGIKRTGRAVVTDTIHPEVLGVAGTFGKRALGEPIAKGVGVHWNAIYSLNDLSVVDKVTSSIDGCVRVKVYKE